MAAPWQTVPSAIAALLLLSQCTATESPSESLEGKPRIQLMTSLPLVWGDDASMEMILSGESDPAPIYRYWQARYDIAAVDSLENLAQDDPDLVWPSELPIADPRRPLASGLLSPLLGHWGLELVAAEKDRVAVDLSFGGDSFATRGIGKLVPLPDGADPDVRCKGSAADFIMQCSVGLGQASIIADADFLNAMFWPESARRSPQKSGAGRFVDSLVRDHFVADEKEK